MNDFAVRMKGKNVVQSSSKKELIYNLALFINEISKF